MSLIKPVEEEANGFPLNPPCSMAAGLLRLSREIVVLEIINPSTVHWNNKTV